MPVGHRRQKVPKRDDPCRIASAAEPLCFAAMGDESAILDSVRRLVERLAPRPICDDCIVERIDDAQPDAIGLASHELAASRDFERDHGDCALCGEHKPTIAKRR